MDIIISFSFKVFIWIVLDDQSVKYISRTNSILESLAELSDYKKSNGLSIDRVFLDVGPGFHTGLRVASIFAKTVHVDQKAPLFTFSWIDCYIMDGRTICFITNREISIYGDNLDVHCSVTKENFQLMDAQYTIDGISVGAHNILNKLDIDERKVLSDQSGVITQYYTNVSNQLNSHRDVNLRYK